MNFTHLVGNTPMIRIRYKLDGREGFVWAKLEAYNLSGSIKDRLAAHVITKSTANGTLKPGQPIVEMTSGNTGISFAAVGAALGHPVVIYMPDWMSRERIAMMKGYGATVRLVSKEEGGFLGSIRMTEELAQKGGVFLPRQFSNPDNSAAHYETTGAEILRQLNDLGLRPDGLVAGVGTGGTVMGIARRLKEAVPACRAFAMEPLNSPTLSTGYKVGKHRIQGISDDFIPDLLQLSELDGVISVDDGDAIIAAQMLSRQLGIGVGISSGANLIGAIMAAERLDGSPVVVTVFSDDNKKYLSTDYAENEPMKDSYYTKDLVLNSVIAHR